MSMYHLRLLSKQDNRKVMIKVIARKKIALRNSWNIAYCNNYSTM